jgi:hypothetical protein
MSTTTTPVNDCSAVEYGIDLSYDEFARGYLYPNKPVVLRDALRGWKALERWSPEFFRDQFGDFQFTITDTEYGQGGTSQSAEFTMADFIGRVLASKEGAPAPYFRNKVFYDCFPSLKNDIEPLPKYLLPNWLGDRYLVKEVGRVLNRGAAIEIYIGGAGGKFPVLHYDGAGTHAFLMQIYGRKQYIIYPPEQEPFLYRSPVKPNLSLLNDVEDPDLERFPLFAKATPIKLVLEPGEMLFVPSHWWHTVRMLTPSITLSANVLNASNWTELMSYVALRQRSPLVSLASKAYLTAAGSWRSWRDRNWRPRP